MRSPRGAPRGGGLGWEVPQHGQMPARSLLRQVRRRQHVTRRGERRRSQRAERSRGRRSRRGNPEVVTAPTPLERHGRLAGQQPRDDGEADRRVCVGQRRMKRFGVESGCPRSHAPAAETGPVWGTEQARRPHGCSQALTPALRGGRRDTRKVSAEASAQRGCGRDWGGERRHVRVAASKEVLREQRSRRRGEVSTSREGAGDDGREASGGKPRRATGAGRLATAGRTTDSRVEQGLEVGSVSQPMTARGQGPAATQGTAAREGKALEGEASVGTSRTAATRPRTETR